MDLVELWTVHYTNRNFFVDAAENRPFKVLPLRTLKQIHLLGAVDHAIPKLHPPRARLFWTGYTQTVKSVHFWKVFGLTPYPYPSNFEHYECVGVDQSRVKWQSLIAKSRADRFHKNMMACEFFTPLRRLTLNVITSPSLQPWVLFETNDENITMPCPIFRLK